ncbi:MAG: lysophospholipid acyltransferase family protein [Chlorobiales bacterium]|nr:lysophospholipid acyltransferase family protein [Chlorobiales bacterium]
MGSLKKRWKRFNQKITYRLFLFLGFLVRRLNRHQFERLAYVIGDFTYYFLRPRRKLVETNLAYAFPEKNAREIGGIARQVYRNQAVNLLEVLRLPLLQSRKDAAKLIDLHLDEFLAKTRARGKGGVLVSGHFGNWELTGVCIGLLVTPIAVVAKKLKNKLVNNEVERLRCLHGNTVIYKKQALRDGLKMLREGGIVTVLGDQSDPKGGFFMDFLGREASVFLGPAFLALRARVPMFALMCRRQSNGKYVLEAEEIDTSDLSFSRENIERLARRYTRALEKYIYRYPEEWFWVHNRWKRHYIDKK